jgi:hypothetical protein
MYDDGIEREYLDTRFSKDEVRRQVINKVIEGRLYKQIKQNN